MRTFLLIFSIFFCFLSVQSVFARQKPATIFNPKKYVCYRAPQRPVIDGVLEKEVWDAAPATSDFQDIEGILKPAPYHKTFAKMLWDKDFLYIAAEMEEPHIWANLTERESIIYFDNDFEVFIDPTNDTHLYYEFEINAFGTEWDLLLSKPYRNGGKPLFGWTIHGMKSAVKIYGTINKPDDKDDKWTVEMALPWEVLKDAARKRKMPKTGDVWRMNFSRVQWETEVVDGKYVKKKNAETGKNLPEYNWVWSEQGLINMHYPERWGFVQFSGITAGEGNEKFVSRAEDGIRADLFEVYYAQKKYFDRHQKYARKTKDLKALLPEKIRKKIKMQSTRRLFEAEIRHEKQIFRIDDEGKISILSTEKTEEKK